MKKINSKFKLLLICLLASFSCQAALSSIQAEAYNATGSATVRAHVYVQDITPPTAPNLLAPFNSKRPYCERTPVFSWQDATDDEGISAYNFVLDGVWYNNATYNFSQYITGEINNDTVQVWHEDGVWYLQLKNYLNWGTYTWNVTAYDSANSTTSPSWNIYLSQQDCNLGCQTSNLVDQVEFMAPNGAITSRKPAIKLKYHQVSLVSAAIYVNNQLVLSNLNLTASYNAPTYTVNLNPSESEIVIQLNQDYLPADTNTYLLKLVLYDNNNCAFSPAVHSLIYGSGGSASEASSSSEALMPILLTPANQLTSSEPVKQFSWSICSPVRYLKNQTFYLDKAALATLGTQKEETTTYTYSLVETQDDECSGGIATTFTLTLTDNLQVNDPNNDDDWHRWSVTATGINGLSMQSPTWRFRFFPEGTAIYSWCTNQKSCNSGTLKQCLSSGSNCYYNDQAQCLNNAELDCSDNPPARTYFWCAGGSGTCTQGTLAACGQSGKNCFLDQNQCATHAASECGGGDLYFSCSSALTCNLTDLATCNSAGGPCYRQESPDQSCPSNVKSNCTTTSGLLDKSFLSRLLDFPGNGFILLQKLGLSAQALKNLQTFFVQLIPWFSLFILLPWAIIVLIWPLARSLVFNAHTGDAIVKALIQIKNNLGVVIGENTSNRKGQFSARKLPQGQFSLQVQAEGFTFPSNTPDPQKQDGDNYYLGQTFTIQTGEFKRGTYQIPLDPVDNTPIKKLTFNAWWRRTSLRFCNRLSFLWPLAAIIAWLITYFYPSIFNLIISFVFILGWGRRQLADRQK